MSTQHETTVFGVLRHARTEWNDQKRIQGQQDSPLTREGVSCAIAWGEVLKAVIPHRWDRILASDLGRTRRTAELINETLQLPVTTDVRLREKDWGEWSGKTFPEIEQHHGAFLQELENAGWAFRPPGGEDRKMVWERSRQALVDAARRWPGQHILVVTHEGVIKCLVYRLTDRYFLPTEPRLLKPLHLHRMAYTDNRLVLDKVNAFPLTPQPS